MPSDYFDQRFIPKDGGTREGLLLSMRATDFGPWPRGVRRHTSEGPLMRYLLTSYLDFDIVADRSARSEAGYRSSETVEWTRTPAPFGLSTLTAPPPDPPRKGQLIGKNDLFIATDPNGQITDIIRCLRPGRTPFQTCEHLIEAGRMDIQLAYAPEFLPDWARLSSGARAFLDCLMS